MTESMTRLFVTVQNLLTRDEEGATMVEYALMLALIAVVCLMAVAFVGTKASGIFSTIASTL